MAVATRAIRVNAAARMVGAPKVVGQRQQPSGAPRTGGTAAPSLGKGITQHQAAAPRPVVQHQARDQAPRQVQHAASKNVAQARQHVAAKASGKPAPKPAAAPKQTAFNPLEGDMNSAQLGKLAGQITSENAQPLIQAQQTQAKEIAAAEGPALQKQAAVAGTEQQQLAGLQAGQEGNAKTAENNAADATVKAANEIQTTGQTVGAATAGYVDPQVQAALGQAASTAGSLGGAASQYASAMGVSGANQMSALRGAAAQRMGEGAQRLGQDYAIAQEKPEAEENKLLAKEPTDAKSLAVELGQKQLTDAATLKSLGVKEGQLGVNAEKATTEKQSKAATNQTNKQKNAVTLTLGEQKNAVTLKAAEIKAKNTLEADGIKNAGAIASAQIKAKSALEIANKKAGRLTTSQEDKLVGELSQAYSTIQAKRTQGVPNQAIRTALANGSESVEQGGKVVKEKNPTIKNSVLVQAALEAWDYHKVSATTEKQLASLGIQNVPKVENGELVFG